MKRLISIILLIVVIFVLSVTNPKRPEYIDWINHQAMDKSSNLFEKGILSLAGKSIFDMGTTQSDYLVFTIYSTDFSEVGMGKITSIGVFNQFIPLPTSKK
jgi:hypothetical protein